jgi:pyridoxine 4-dehydrogenase
MSTNETVPVGARAYPGGAAQLGGRSVARIGYGAMQLAERAGRQTLDHAEAVAVLRRARELGVNHIDTAQFYGDGVANGLIRDALHPYADDTVLVSKVGAVRVAGGPSPLMVAQKPFELRAAVEDNLTALRAERLDVVNLRRADNPPGIIADGDQIVPLDDQLTEMISLRDQGKIGGIGLSNVSFDQVEAALPAGIACVQNAYNLVLRTDEPLLELCLANGIAWVPYFPLGSGFPGQRRVTDEPEVQDVARRLGATPSQVGLAWLLAHAPNVLLIPGTSSIEHLDQNVAAGSVVLDAAALAALA